MNANGPGRLLLDGDSLTIAELVRVARDPEVTVECEASALEGVRRGRARITVIVEEYKHKYAAYQASRKDADRPTLTYGVTTGFGEFKRIPIPPDEIEALQRNVLLSHAIGVGDNADVDDPGNYLPAEVVRAALVLRLNALLKGHSGVRVELARCIAAMINRGVVPLVPTKGSVGASGDLCPMAHLFGVLVGAGRFYLARRPDAMTMPSADVRPASALGDVLGDALVEPAVKEGLALTNGTTISTALLALVVHDAEFAANTADIAAAMSLEAVCGRARAFDPMIHQVRGQVGQIDSAANIRALIAGSRLIDRADDVQDVYSLRCAPQVHGASRDAIGYARSIVLRELNAVTDNPLFFPDGTPWDEQFRANRVDGAGDEAAYSAGNFHGQPIGIAADVLAIALAELANISERRTQMLLDRNHNRNLPANLIANRGLNSGYMLAQYTAASLVSENKVLAHPASVDSIPTAANTEDHVAMATGAARKVGTVLSNAQAVLAVELLCVTQALEWRVAMNRGPNPADAPATPATGLTFESARTETADFERATAANHRDTIAKSMGRGTAAVYAVLRAAAQPLIADRSYDGDLAAIRRLVANGAVVRGVEAALDAELLSISS